MRTEVPGAEGNADPAKPVRLFVAVDVPEVHAAALAARVEPLRASIPGARWTRRAGWHVTLKFLGSTPVEGVPDVEAAVRTVAEGVVTFGSRITRLGAFPSPSRARVLWAGLDDETGAFAGMVNQLDELLAAYAEPEGRAFTPHLTLARIQPPARIAPDVRALDVGSGPFAVDRLILYRSHLSPKGATYEAMLTAALRDGPGA